MEPYSAWHALIHTNTFIWYLIMALVSLGLAITRFIQGFEELQGNDTDELLTFVQKSQRQCEQSNDDDVFARWKVDIPTILMEIKYESRWSQGKKGEALMMAALYKALSYIKFIDIDESEITTVAAFLDFLKNHPSFKEVSGAAAQGIANRQQLAIAICPARSEEQTSAVALVIPGEIYPGTPFGNDNPMILWVGQDAVMELQAAVAFSDKNKPSYYAIKNLEC